MKNRKGLVALVVLVLVTPLFNFWPTPAFHMPRADSGMSGIKPAVFWEPLALDASQVRYEGLKNRLISKIVVSCSGDFLLLNDLKTEPGSNRMLLVRSRLIHAILRTVISRNVMR